MAQPPRPPVFAASPFLRRPEEPDPSRPPPLALKGKAGRRAVARLEAARDVVGLLPQGEGDSLVVLIAYGYDPVLLLQVLVEELTHAHGRVDHLRVASLSTSKRCTEILARLMDAGKVGQCSFLLSEFQRKHDKPIFAHAREELAEARGAAVAAQRSHVKAWLLHFADGS